MSIELPKTSEFKKRKQKRAVWLNSADCKNELPEMSFCKRMAGTGLEIFFKRFGSMVIVEPDHNTNFPGFESCGMGRFAGIMVFDPSV